MKVNRKHYSRRVEIDGGWYTFLLLTCFFFFTAVLFSQGYQVRQYSEKDGLPAVPVYDMTQDHWGRMWFATRTGIAVYDGMSWKQHTLAKGLPAAGFSIIKIDIKGRLWILAERGIDGIVGAYLDISDKTNNNEEIPGSLKP
jgi:hypothetical protein